LLTGAGEVLGEGHDPAGAGRLDPALARAVSAQPPGLALRRQDARAKAALVSTCSRSLGAHTVWLMGARHIEPMLTRIGEAYGVRLALASPDAHPRAVADPAEERRLIDQPVPELAGLQLVAAISRAPLEQHLASVDRRILLASALTVAVAIVTAMAMARSLARPLEELAQQAGEVVFGDPRPVQARGGRELRAFAQAFNKAIEDLTELRKRLATTERIAARREIARQVAHEIKNPLAPIRAAVETLRRLRARNDPAFDAYFDEATRTVLDEVFRISKIVSEFTEFARLPAPTPQSLQLDELVKRVVSLYVAGGAAITVRTEPCPAIAGDRDQLTQVITNLVQNALDAVKGVDTPMVEVEVRPRANDRVEVVVTDNGPGVADNMLPRLFEPYATDKVDGTGLGLAIVQRIVHEHGGTITHAKSVTGAGAVFRVNLPVAGPFAPIAATSAGGATELAPRG